MLDTHTDIARAAIEATFLPRRAAFPRDIDHSRRVLAASRELLKRLRQSHGDDTSRAWEDADPVPFAISAFEPMFSGQCSKIWCWEHTRPNVNGAIWLRPWYSNTPGAIRSKLACWIGSPGSKYLVPSRVERVF
ncbi:MULTISPECIES: hypothetical protein [unclassified Mesorhizobium]|uniref:hypothetical protein n=1 Tax=unclassified Mesorhizobium TaxID=325217 RepID=UPI001CD177A7|nr:MULTISPECIES: hypothetical protein [unclassified Mesorhizobium]MBZ9971527.1 hypothetical protein [Mesorhizobium sp. BR1-1-12]